MNHCNLVSPVQSNYKSDHVTTLQSPPFVLGIKMRLLDTTRETCASPHRPLWHQPGFSLVSVLQLHRPVYTYHAPSSPLSRTLLLLLYFIDLGSSLITPQVKYCFPGKAPWASPTRSHPPSMGMWSSPLFSTCFRRSDRVIIHCVSVFSTKL